MPVRSKPDREKVRRSPRPPLDCDAVRGLLLPEVRAILDEFALPELVSHLLRRAHFQAEELFAQEFAPEALTPRQKAALVCVYQTPGMNQTELAGRLFMDRNTVAELVQRLVRAGLVRRASASADQRAYQLFLAPAGAKLLNRVMVRDALVEERLLERLPREYRPLFIKCLRLLVEAEGRSNNGASR
jgi:DNA-binding MarR family transcriptional regulator